MWKRAGSGQTAAKCGTYVRDIAHRAAPATGGSRPQPLLAPYKQEVARSSRAPALGKPLPKRDVWHRSSRSACRERDCGSVWERTAPGDG